MILEMLSSSNAIPSDNHGGRGKMGGATELLIFVWYVANNDTYRGIADCFNVSESSALSAVRKITE